MRSMLIYYYFLSLFFVALLLTIKYRDNPIIHSVCKKNTALKYNLVSLLIRMYANFVKNSDGARILSKGGEIHSNYLKNLL